MNDSKEQVYKSSDSKLLNCWLSPQGKVTWCGVMCHEEEAIEIIDELFSDEFEEKPVRVLCSTDYLMIVKHYVKLEQFPSMLSPRWQYQHKPNRIQLKKMFDLTSFVYTED